MSCHAITSRVMMSCLVSLSVFLWQISLFLYKLLKNMLPSFDQPNFELLYCEATIRLVSQHVLATFNWDFINRSISPWSAVSNTIKWFSKCTYLSQNISKSRTTVSSTKYRIPLFWDEELTLARQVKQNCSIVNRIFLVRCPLSRGITSNAISVYYLKKRYCRCLVVTTRVKVFTHPAMKRTTIE